MKWKFILDPIYMYLNVEKWQDNIIHVHVPEIK